jgi:hypothetical protein
MAQKAVIRTIDEIAREFREMLERGTMTMKDLDAALEFYVDIGQIYDPDNPIDDRVIH